MARIGRALLSSKLAQVGEPLAVFLVAGAVICWVMILAHVYLDTALLLPIYFAAE